jgi:hypothetical protein
MKEEFIKCSCGAEIIQVSYDSEWDGLDMSFFKYGHESKYNLAYKLRLIWTILTKGHPYSDNVVLDEEGRKKLIDFLIEVENEKDITTKESNEGDITIDNETRIKLEKKGLDLKLNTFDAIIRKLLEEGE